MPKPQKPATMLHEIATWAFMAGIALAAWWFIAMWPVYQSGGPAAMISDGFKDWRLYATWASWILSFVLFNMGENRRGKDALRKQ